LAWFGPGAVRVSSAAPPDDGTKVPAIGNAWMYEDGVRASWFGYKVCDDAMLEHLRAAHVNTVILGIGMHDLLDLDTARRDAGQFVVSPRETTLKRLLPPGVHPATLAEGDEHVRELTMQSLKRYINQFKEEVARYEANHLV